MSSAWRRWRKPIALGLLLACGAADAAWAQFFFRPFFHSWRYGLPPDEAEIPRYASRRAVARILARVGFELVGPLARRGDQIVATGVNRRGGEARFFIDPFEGQILHATRLGAPPANGRAWAEDQAIPPEGARPPAQDMQDFAPDAGAPRRASRIAPAIPEKATPPRGETVAPSAARPREAAPPKPGDAQMQQEPSGSGRTEEKLDPLAAQKAPERPLPARSTDSSHRAIVPPKAAEGGTAAPPSAPSSTMTNERTPLSAAPPKGAP